MTLCFDADILVHVKTYPANRRVSIARTDPSSQLAPGAGTRLVAEGTQGERKSSHAGVAEYREGEKRQIGQLRRWAVRTIEARN
jgi:hypothetical protein